MSSPARVFLASVLALLGSGEASAAAQGSNCAMESGQEFRVARIDVDSKPIFDEAAADAIALHRWANALHVITKPVIVLERLTFDEGDLISQEDLIEAEAILRALRYLANAELEAIPDCAANTVIVKVTTFDNWSLIPTLSFSRSGGQNNSLIGVREDNLFGLGIRATARYNEDEQRSGYRVTFASIVPGIRHANMSIRIADNDDGEVYSVAFDKPFYHLDTQTRVFAQAASIRQVEDIFQNDETRNSFELNSHQYSAAYGWQLSSDNLKSKRFSVGLSREQSSFSLALESPSADLSLVPESRDFLFPWLLYEYAERRIVVMEDIYLINQPEDINLGWQWRSQLGLEVDNGEGGMGVHTNLSVNKGYAFDGNKLIMLNARLNVIKDAGVEDLWRLETTAEYFYRRSPLVGYYSRLSSTFSEGQFLDRPIVIDDDNGVRGFPNQYQHGDHRVSASAEVRFYTEYSIYQLFEVGFASFVDVGRAYGGEQALLNADGGWISSIGIGARLFSNKSSNSGVVHIDISRPMADDEGVNSWEWSLQLRRSF